MVTTGLRPKFLAKLAQSGVHVDTSVFAFDRTLTMGARTMRWAAAGAAIATLSLGTGVAWAAPEGRIQQVESVDGAVTYILSAEGLAEGESIDPASVRTTLGGVDAPTTAAPVAAESGPVVGRTTMIVLDSSGSMAEDGKLAKAQEAAKQYLDTLPADVKAGLVTFADEASVKVAPTEDRATVEAAIDALTATGATALNDAVVLTVDELGTEGSRNAVLLSDGEDEGSDASAKSAAKALKKSGVVLDAVSLGTGKQTAQLAAFAKAGNGNVVTATDAAELTAAFEEAARSVVTQLAVTAQIPEGVEAGTSEMVAAALVGDTPITDSAVAVIKTGVVAAPTASAPAYGPIAVQESEASFMTEPWFLPVVLGMMFLALAAIVALVIGALDKKNRQQGRVKRRLQEVSLAGAPAASAEQTSQTTLGTSTTVRKAVSFADKVAASRDTSALAQKLDEANVALRPGEWAVVHMLIIVLAGLLTTLLSGFNILITLIAIAIGRHRALVLPRLPNAASAARTSMTCSPIRCRCWRAASRPGTRCPRPWTTWRRSQAARWGWRSTGHSSRAVSGSPSRSPSRLWPSAWTVRTSTGPSWPSGSTGRSAATSQRCSRNVAKTVRERERLRRQVKALSAEGKLSAWILALLPIGVGLFVAWRNPGYLEPLFTTLVGWVMIGVGVVLYLIGVLWMRNLVNMEV